MAIEEALKIIKDGRIAAIIIRGNNEDETKFNQENIEALNVIVDTMRKYQKIEEIVNNTFQNITKEDERYAYEWLGNIKEVIEDGNNDN